VTLSMCSVEADLDRYLTRQDKAEARYAAAEADTADIDFEGIARDWLMSDRPEDFWPDYPRNVIGIDVLMEFISCTDTVSQVSIAKVLFGVAKPEETELCRHKLGLLVEEYAEKFKEREIRSLQS